MPSVSEKQARFMQAVAHNPKFAKEVDVPQSVGKEFASADDRSGGRPSAGKHKHERIYNRSRKPKANDGG